MRQVLLAADAEGNPAGIWNPVVLDSQTIGQQRVMDRSRKGNVNNTVAVDMANFGAAYKEFNASETMWVRGDVSPSRDLL